MFKKLLVMVLFMSAVDFVVAQDLNYEQNIRRTKKKYRLHSIPGITKKICKNIENDSLKNQLIYYWISNNIRYDTRRLNKGKLSFQSPKKTKRHRKAHDAGFSSLYQKMLLHAGIESELIKGHFRESNSQKTDAYYRENYTWNAVNINGTWYLTDIVWASGHLKKKPRKFSSFLFKGFGIPYIKYKYSYKKERDSTKFPASPMVFIRTHFPSDPMWQLLDYPESIKKFEMKDSLACLDSVKHYFNYQDSILKFISDPASKRNLKYARISNPFNKKNHETAAVNLKEYLKNNFIEISMSSQLTRNTRLDSLKASFPRHAQATNAYNNASKMITEEYNFKERRNDNRRYLITGTNKNLIRKEKEIIQKNNSKAKKAKIELKRTSDDVQKSRIAMKKIISIPFKNPKKADKPSIALQQAAEAGLLKSKNNLLRLYKIKLLCDSILAHSDSLTLKFLQLSHYNIDSLYSKSIKLVSENTYNQIEYDYKLEDRIFSNRDSIIYLSQRRAKIRDSISGTEKSLVNESLKELKKLNTEARALVKESKKLLINADKYLGYYDAKKTEFDSLNKLLKSIYLDLFDMLTLKTKSLREDRQFYQLEIANANLLTKEYHREMTVENKRHQYEEKKFRRERNYLQQQSKKGKKEVSDSKQKYKNEIKKLETEIKNYNGPKQRS